MKIQWQVNLNPSQFYESRAMNCPRCHSQFNVEAPPQMVLASDVLGDKCPICGAYLVVNMMHEVMKTADVIIEGYSTIEEMEAREVVLANAFNELRKWKSLSEAERARIEKPGLRTKTIPPKI